MTLGNMRHLGLAHETRFISRLPAIKHDTKQADIAGDPSEIGGLWLTASRIDVPAVGEVLHGEFQTEAAICAGNQDGWHWLFIPVVNEATATWNPERKAELA